MAESVDALVSNTSGAIRAGSIPALGTVTDPMKVAHKNAQQCWAFFVYPCLLRYLQILWTSTEAGVFGSKFFH